MKWSWKIGKLAGIDLYVHATFLLLLGWVAMSHWSAGKSLDTMVSGVVFILALFACVLLHELGHALAARRFGIATRDITLLPIGGLARLERMPEKPREELWVTLAGPAVNVIIAAALYIWLTLTSGWVPLGQLAVGAGPFLERILVANVYLVVFNLIPAFPMDGGRVLRALLATRMEYLTATQIAAGLGQGLAYVFGFIGLFTSPFLLFIALFVWIGAAQEASAVQMKTAFAGTPIRAAMLTEFQVLKPSDTLADAVNLILQGSQQDFPVVEHSGVIGILTRADLLVALAKHRKDHAVAPIMRRDFVVAAPTEMLDVVFRRLAECECHTLPVLHDGRLLGLVTMDNLGEYLLIQAALKQNDPHATMPEGVPGQSAVWKS
jgi:Zn-dependent protease/predicted transcriptional regulator